MLGSGPRTWDWELDFEHRQEVRFQLARAMPRPVPTRIYHFTHIHHLPDVLRCGLLADTAAQKAGLLVNEVGNRGIKERRRSRRVPITPGGVVADYATFYFAPRSPMMYSINRGNVPEYTDGIDPLAYLVTDIDRLMQMGLTVLTTDRNAVLDYAEFASGTDGLDTIVDWQLMRQTMWKDTPEEPDRMERRMAECLVHEAVPWEAFTAIHVRTEARRVEVQTLMASFEVPPITVERAMYY